MIKGRCFTNDDTKNKDWPTKFVAVPRVGECVEARSGQYMKVARVTHVEYKDIVSSGENGFEKWVPMIYIELVKV